ncbi:MAG TPA: hypothetical protein VF530_12450 [Planctomycetota bacterium]
MHPTKPQAEEMTTMTMESGSQAPHAYSFQIGEHGGWADGLTPAEYEELKGGLRLELLRLVQDAPEPWEYPLRDLVRRYRIRSLHAIPAQVHRELLEGWLEGINRKRKPDEQLFLPQNLEWCCELVPPKLWRACASAEILIGKDAQSAKPWKIALQSQSGNKVSIPVTVGATWTCEATGTYRKDRKHGDWHSCSNCIDWPRVNYETSSMPPRNEDLCSKCRLLVQKGECTTPHLEEHLAGTSAGHAT